MRSIDLILSGRKPRSGVRINEGIGVACDHPEIELTRALIGGSEAAIYHKVDTKPVSKILLSRLLPF